MDIAFIIISSIFIPVIYGRVKEWGELRRMLPFSGTQKKGKKQVIHFKYKNKVVWSSWNYYYVYTDGETVELIPPVMFKFFMPKLKLRRNAGNVSESQQLVWLKKKTVYELEGCSVLLAL